MIDKNGRHIKLYRKVINWKWIEKRRISKIKTVAFHKILKEINPVSFLFTFCF